MMSSDEIDHSSVVKTTTAKLDVDNLNKNGDLKNLSEINHPLSLNNNNNDNTDSSDMREINLSIIHNDENENLTSGDTENVGKKKLNWVKFEEDDPNDDNIDNKLNAPAIELESKHVLPALTLSVAQTSNNINNNIIDNDIMENDITTTTKNKITPPPRKINSKNSPVTNSQDQSNPSSSKSDVIGGAAVLQLNTTESVHVNLNNSSTQKPNATNHTTTNNSPSTSTAIQPPNNVSIAIPPAPTMRTIELSTGRVREGFANGDVIVTLLPTNTKWPWITPAVFRPELVPEELMAQGLTLTVEEYVNAMETLVNDYRFTIYNVCYKRVLVCWILFAFCVLLTLLFSGLQGIALFSLGVGWLFLNAAAIFFCMWIKLRLSRGLEKCLARVNKLLLRHKILLVLDDRGRLSCHKVNLSFMYFDPAQCIAHLNDFIASQEQNGNAIQEGWEKKLDIDVEDIVIQGANPVRLSRKQAVAQEIFLTYLQRWGKDFLRNRLNWTINEAGVHESPRHLTSSEELSISLFLRYFSRYGNELLRGLVEISITEPARHCAMHICPCQYIERHLSYKPRVRQKRVDEFFLKYRIQNRMDQNNYQHNSNNTKSKSSKCLKNNTNPDMASYWPYGGQFLSPICPPAGYSLLSATPYPMPVYQTTAPASVFDQSQMRPQQSATISTATNTSRNNDTNNNNNNNNNGNMCIQIGFQCFNQNNTINLNSLNDMSVQKNQANLNAEQAETNINQNAVTNESLSSSNDGSSPQNNSNNSNNSSFGDKEFDKKFCNRLNFDFCEAKNVEAIPGGSLLNGGSASLKKDEIFNLSQKKFADLTRLAMRGSETAERLAYTHRNRPCFKKIDSLCARMKQDLIRPDGVLPNINSQGIAWAVKDFIFVFTRIINAWIIIKGYVYNTPEGLNKVRAALSPDFIRSFAAWQDTTMDFVENLIKSFINLDQLVTQSQKTPTTSYQQMKTNGTPSKPGSTTAGGDFNTLFDDSFDFLNVSTEFSKTSTDAASNLNTKSYYSTLVEDSEESQRKATANGTYFKTGVYNPILKDSISELDPIYFTAKKETVDPVYEPQKSTDEFEWSSGTVCSTTTLKTDENANFRPPNNGEGDGKPTKDDGKLKLNTNCFDYNLKILERNVTKYSTPVDQFDTRLTDTTKMIKKIEYLMNEIRNFSVGNLFFSKQFMKNYFPDFADTYPKFLDLRSIFLKAQIGGYRNINEFVHDLRLIIYYGKLYLKTKKDELLDSSITKYENELNKILKDDVFKECLFDVVTGDPNETI